MANATAPTNPTTGVPVTATGLATGAGHGPPIIHTNYKEFYGDASIHPRWSPDYAPLIDIMNIIPTNAIAGPTICTGIRDNQNKRSFMCMGLFEDPADLASPGQINVIHRLTYLSASFGGTTDPIIHDKVYGIVGDLMTGRQVAKVVVPPEAFDEGPATFIASDQVFNAATSSGTLPDTYGPYVTGAVDNRVTKTRSLCFITPHVAALILESASRTPRGILELLGPILDMAHYGPMFNWLRVAQTVDDVGQSLVTRSEFLSAPYREEVNHLIMTIVGHDLPMMGHAPIHQVGEQITNALGNFTATYVAQNEADRLHRIESSESSRMTIDKKFTFQADPLRNLLQVTSLSNAPSVWKVIADNPMKQARQVLQTALNETCYKLHVKAPTVVQALARVIVDVSLWRCADGPDNVLQGLSLFHVLLRPSADERERMKAAASYDLAMSTGSSITSQDTFFFNNPGNVNTTWVEPLVAKTTLKNMWALCTAIFGTVHTVTMGLHLALDRWDEYEMQLHTKYACSPDTWTMEVLYWFHRQLSHWIDSQYHSKTPIPFEVDSLFSNIFLGNIWSRGIPFDYMPARLIPSAASPSLISAITPPSVSPSTVSTAPTTSTASTEPRVDNTVYQPPSEKSARLTAFAALQHNRRLQTIISVAYTAGNHVPKDASNEPFCMTYHILGRCNQTCRRIRNHRRLTDPEVASLATFCEAAF
jgi:hypothetical protein